MPSSPAPVSTAARPKLTYETLALVLGDPTRWRILEVLSEGEPQMAKELAVRVRKDASLVSKHLAVMRKAGIVVVGRGRLNHLAPAFHPVPGSREIDIGRCLFRFGNGK